MDMAFKTGGYKTKYIYEYSYLRNEYTIYCAVDSTVDMCVYKMLDDKGNEKDISIAVEDDTDDYGNRSLIDCLYCLKNREDKKYSNKSHDIKVEEMTDKEMKEIFGR
jgi:hypothetical protein